MSGLPIVFTVPLRVLSPLWPGGGCLVWVVLGLMVLGAVSSL